MAVRFTLRQLEYFVAVGEAGSITVAAGIVNVSPPSISAAIAQLEDEFGLALFVRKHARGLTLTQAGRQLMTQAVTLLQDAQKIAQLACDISGKVQGPLALGCLVTFAQQIVPSLRREFETTNPEVQISQTEQNQKGLFTLLRAGKIDLALTYDLDIPQDLSFAPLAELPPYAVFNTSHPLAHQPLVSVHELCDHPMVLLDLPLSTDYFLSFFEDAGQKPTITERTRDIAVMRSLVANGFGYSILNFRPLNDHAPDGRKLRFVPLKGDVRPMKLGLLTSAGAENALCVQAFIEHCRAHLPGIIMPDAG